MEASFETKDEYILITAQGRASVTDASRILMSFVKTYSTSPIYKLLCDMRTVTGSNIEDGLMPRFQYGALIAKLLPRRYKLVLLMTERQIDKQRFGENVIANRGVQVKVTTDLNEALAWLEIGTTLQDQ